MNAPTPLAGFRIHGRELEPDTEVSITGERGRFRFMRATTTSTGQIVLDFIGGVAGHETWRSFYPARVKTVHRINRTRRTKRHCDASARPQSNRVDHKYEGSRQRWLRDPVPLTTRSAFHRESL